MLAASLKEHVDRHQEVDQSSSNIEHNLSACRETLAFGLKWFRDDHAKGTWKLWLELLKHASNAAALVVSYSPPELEDSLAKVILGRLQGQKVDLESLGLFSRLLDQGLFANIPFSTLKKDVGIKPILNICLLYTSPSPRDS